MVSKILCALCVVVLFGAILARAVVGGGISGTVKDPSGEVVVNASVTVSEMATGLVYRTHTDGKGYYTLPVLPVGRYQMEVKTPGFRTDQRKDIAIDTNAALRLDVALEIGSVDQTVSVDDDTLHVETSSSQFGQLISGRQMTAVPLDGRSFTDLLSLQAGVAPATSITSTTVQDVGATVLNPSGTLNPGTVSVNGQREFANFFTVNGSTRKKMSTRARRSFPISTPLRSSASSPATSTPSMESSAAARSA
jgi:hypothetical protein